MNPKMLYIPNDTLAISNSPWMTTIDSADDERLTLCREKSQIQHCLLATSSEYQSN